MTIFERVGKYLKRVWGALFILPILVLASCSNIPIDNQIHATRAALTVAQKGAMGYVDQPLCGTTEAKSATICSKLSVIKKIKMADSSAMTALAAAEEAQTEEALKIAQTAFKALLEITSNILAEK